MGKSLETQTQKGYEFYVNNQPWNGNMHYLELWAAFAKPELASSNITRRKGWFRRLMENDRKEILKVDATEGRYKKVVPIFKKYGMKAVSGGIDPMCVSIPASSRKEAESNLEAMFNEVNEVIGPDYSLKLEIHDISFSLIPSQN